jgi:hypothetical protein
MPTGGRPVKTFNKPLATETADIHSLSHARVDGTRVDGNGHHNGRHNGHHNGHHSGRRRRRPQVRDGVRLAAAQANAGLRLVRQLGFTVRAAVQGTGSNARAIAAMGVLHDYGDPELLAAVLFDEVPFLPTAERIKPIVKTKRAFNAMSTADQITWARQTPGGPEKLFDNVVVPAMEPPQVNLVF